MHTSKIYDGMKSEYWIYVPAQYDPKTLPPSWSFRTANGISTATPTTPP